MNSSKKMRRWTTGIIVGFYLMCGSLIAHEPESAKTRQTTSQGDIPFELHHGELMMVNVQINGKGPYRFAVDSGANRTLVTADLFEELNLPEMGRRRVPGVAGGRPLLMTRLEKAALGNTTWENLETVAIPGDILPGGGVDGMLGAAVFREHAVTIDYTQKTIHFQPSAPEEEEKMTEAEKEENNEQRIPLEISGEYAFVPVRINGEGPYLFVLDTGAGRNVIDPFLAKELKLPKTGEEPMHGVGASRNAVLVGIERLSIGEAVASTKSLVVWHGPIRLTSARTPVKGIVGTLAFSEYRICIDYPKRRLTLIRPAVSSNPEPGNGEQ